MQFAKLFGKIISASIHAPRQAWCVYCDKPVYLADQSDENGFSIIYVHYNHQSNEQCLAARDKAQRDSEGRK